MNWLYQNEFIPSPIDVEQAFAMSFARRVKLIKNTKIES